MLVIVIRFSSSIADMILAFFTKKTLIYAQNQKPQKNYSQTPRTNDRMPTKSSPRPKNLEVGL